jgi:uncharacterized protein
LTYGGVTLEANFDGGSLTVGGASRIPNGTDTDTVGDWVRNAFDITNATIQQGDAYNTPNDFNRVPEPASLAMMLLGAASLFGLRRPSR